MRTIGLLLVAVALTAAPPLGAEPPRTLLVTRSLTHERLLPYLEQARPDLAQIGNYGAMFHGYADNPRSTGWPMQLPVAGQREALAYQRNLNRQVHQLGLKVVGHFRLVKVMGNWQDQDGFVEFYQKRWPEDLLGPKPDADLVELLQRDGQGEPIQLGRYNQSQLALCLNSPYARQMLRQMLKVAVDQGIDGVITTYNYNAGCSCPYCQASFKEWLRDKLTADQVRQRLGIDNLAAHHFEEIPADIPGYPATDRDEDPLPWLAAEWAAQNFKERFDQIFIEYGRSLKNDLIVAQWNHLGHVGLNEERNFTHLDAWARDEDYLWYSGGAAFVDKNHDLGQGKAGDAWLSCLYVREMSGGKPFVIGKYDRTRMEASMAEGFATGGLGMGRYMRFEEPAGFDALVSYTQFRHANQELYQNATVHADVALVLPRQSVLGGRPEALDAFRSLGQQLVERQVLIDVVLDQKLSLQRLRRYPFVVLPKALALSDQQVELLTRYAEAGGKVIQYGTCGTLDEAGHARDEPAISAELRIEEDQAPAEAADLIQKHVREHGGSSIAGQWTLRANAYSQPGRRVLHLVNYDREDDAPTNNRTGTETERPRAAEQIRVELPLAIADKPRAVIQLGPELSAPVRLPFEWSEGRVSFTVPKLRVYGVVVIEYDEP